MHLFTDLQILGVYVRMWLAGSVVRLSTLLRDARLLAINGIHARSQWVHVEALEPSKQLWPKTGEELEQWWPNLKLPFKLRRYEAEFTREFLETRIRDNPDGYPELRLEQFEELYCDLTNDEAAQQRVKSDIERILVYYNDFMRNNIFGPSRIEVDDMRKMLEKYDSHSARLRYVHFLFIREFDVWRKAKAKDEERQERKRREEEEEANFSNIGCFDDQLGHLHYGYWRNTLFLRYWDQTTHRYSRHTLRNAALWGQKLVVDCGYDEQMADYETTSVARQITKIYHMNRFSRDPFHVMFCGYNPNARWYEYLRKKMGDIIDRPEFVFNLYREPFDELFTSTNSERLIYLSPDTRNTMTEFDPNAVYILGALVSKTYKAALSFQKARQLNIECQRLPIHQYVRLKPGVKKVLSFEGVFHILQELKQHGDWHRAFQAGIMQHKMMPFEELSQHEKIIQSSSS